MRTLLGCIVVAVIAAGSLQTLCAQDLAPRAYLITPIHANAVTLTNTFSTGSIEFSNSLPITGLQGKIDVPIVSLYHSLNFFGRSSNVTAWLPYAVANYHGTLNYQGIVSSGTAYRSGLLDSFYRFAVNLKGGPAMSPEKFAAWQQKTVLGVSLKVVAPTGQYDPSRLINGGANRWAFKPEFGFSRRWGHYVLDTYGAVWFFTTNSKFFSQNAFSPGINTQSQKPIGALEAHLSYDVRPRFWVSIDSNYWYGGRTSVNHVENRSSLLANSRIGATGSVPLNKHQSVKVSYNYGTLIRFGGNFQDVSAAWQYSWLGRPN